MVNIKADNLVNNKINSVITFDIPVFLMFCSLILNEYKISIVPLIVP